MIAVRRRSFLLPLACALSLPACERDAPLPGRHDRYGILRDLVWYPRPVSEGGPFWLDRFETTRGDWLEWLRATGGLHTDAHRRYQRWNATDEPGLPVVGIDQQEARRFARWRFGRLPRYDEWRYAATSGGRHRLPWGDTERHAWANTAELGLPGLTVVGVFESGRDIAGAYDLIGNAAEWTESLQPGFLTPFGGTPPFDLGLRTARLDRHPAALAWRVSPSPWPVAWLVAASARSLPRLIVRGVRAPLSPLGHEAEGVTPWQAERFLAASRSSDLGMRVATDPATLVERLLAVREVPGPGEAAALRAFLRRPESREALRNALRRALDAGDPDGGPLLPLLGAELRP